VPQVLLPTQTEQYMLTRTVTAQRVALGLAGASDPVVVGRALDEARESRALRDAARAMAATVAQMANADPAGSVAVRLLAAADGRS
jgi:hypothetical protein